MVEETREQQAHRTPWWQLLLIGLLLLGLVPALAFRLLYRQVRPVTDWELTGGCPPASALMRDGGEGTYASDVTRIDWTRPGTAWVLISGSDGPRIALVRVRDTTAPAARGVPQVLGVDETIGPDAFIADLSDRQPVGVSFETAPAFHTAGEWPVVIRLEDLSGNVSFVRTSCTILGAVPRVDMEAGEAVPPLRAFLPNDTVEGRFVTDLGTIDTDLPGVYPVAVEAGGEVYETALVVRDTVAPVCAFEDTAYTGPGEALDPQSLVVSAQDVTALAYSFAEAPDWDREGYQDVTVAVTDAGGNRTMGTVSLLISRLRPLAWELGEEVTAAAAAARQRALDGGFAGSVVLDSFTPRTLGCFDVNALADGTPCVQRLYVADTTAPRLTFVKKLKAYLDHPVAPETLLARAEDATALTFFYAAEPDWGTEGPQTVAVAAVDAAGNRAQTEGTIEIVRDTVKPQIFGVMNQNVYIGDAVTYFATAYATDNADAPADIELTVDNAAVDPYTPGVYPVIYRARDRAGNVAERRAYIYMVRPTVSDEKLDAKAEEILAKLVTDDMTPGQKAYAIYCYVYDNFAYWGGLSYNKRDWKQEAWKGLTRQRGGCFTYCAAARILLEKTGAKVMFVDRNSKVPHHWLLVDVGTGWYHFDPLNSGPSARFRCFMFTTEQTRTLYPFFWQYDQRVYPATATEPFIKDW